MSEPRVSFIIPVFNRLDLTGRFIENLRETTPGDDWNAVIVDDGSTDGTLTFLKGMRPPFSAIRLEQNGGYARAVNRGVAATTGRIVGLLNNDLVLRRGWLEPMLRLLTDESNVGAVGNVQMNPATGRVDHAGVFFDPQGMPSHAHKHRRRPPPGPWRERNACTAACVILRRSVFDELGGFCEEYRNGMEDIDLCVRLRAGGRRILVSHESVIDHLVGSSPGRDLANRANTEVFRRRCAATAAAWGGQEWPAEYLRRYAERLHRIDPILGFKAVMMLLGIRKRTDKSRLRTVPSPPTVE